MAASYVAMKCKKTSIDFAFIDRTFASLDNVAFWGAGASLLKSSISSTHSSRPTCCCLKREKFSLLVGKVVSRIFRLVTLWKDNNWQNYAGIEKSKAKYCLIGCDPVHDNIVMDLSNLKNANTRHLIYEKLDVPIAQRSKYLLRLKDYFLVDSDVEQLATILENWQIQINNMNYLMENKDVCHQILNSSEGHKSRLNATETNTYMTEDNELVAQKYAQLEAENLQSHQSIHGETASD